MLWLIQNSKQGLKAISRGSFKTYWQDYSRYFKIHKYLFTYINKQKYGLMYPKLHALH